MRRVNAPLRHQHAAAGVHVAAGMVGEIVVEVGTEDNRTPGGQLSSQRVPIGFHDAVEAPDLEVRRVRVGRVLVARGIGVGHRRETRTPTLNQQVHRCGDGSARSAVEVVFIEKPGVEVARARLVTHRIGTPLELAVGGVGRRGVPGRPGRARAKVALVADRWHKLRQISACGQLRARVGCIWVDRLGSCLHDGRVRRVRAESDTRRRELLHAIVRHTAIASRGTTHKRHDTRQPQHTQG